MGVLDTFYVLFKTDADKAAKEIRDVDKAADGAERGLLKMDAAAAGLGRSFVGLASTLAAPIIALASAGGALSIALGRINEIDDIGDAAGKLRTSVADYDAFTRAVQGSGGALADAQENLATFDAKLADAAARPDGPNAKNFAKWKIMFKDAKGEALGAVDGILALSKSLEGVGQAEAIGRLKRLGITDADTIAFLLQGKQAILEKMDAEKRAGVVTERQIEIVGEYQSALGGTRNLLDTFANRMTELVVPALTRGLNAFSRIFGWLLDHETLVKGFFVGVATVITAVYLPAIASAAAATIAATWPFLAIGAAVAAVGAAFALAYEDVVAFMNGQPSLIGDLLAKYEWLREGVAAIGRIWQTVKSVIADAITEVLGYVQVFVDIAKTVYEAWKSYLAMFQPLFDAFGNLFRAIGDVAQAVFTRISADVSRVVGQWKENFNELRASVVTAFADLADKLRPFVDGVKVAADVIKLTFETLVDIIKAIWGGMIDAMAGAVNRVAESVRGLLNIGSGGINVNVNGASNGYVIDPARNALNLANAEKFGIRTPATIGATGAGGPVNNTSNVSVGGVTVNTQATDAKGIAGAVRGALQNELRNTSSHFDDGVDR